MMKRSVPGKDPAVLRVVLRQWIGGDAEVELVNDGVQTERVWGVEAWERTRVLQTRAAFRGMVGALTDLGIADLEVAEGLEEAEGEGEQEAVGGGRTL